MRKFLALVFVSTALTACLGPKQGPNEMAVLESVPLTLPPNFELRPPRQGQSKAVEMANAKAEALILGHKVSNAIQHAPETKAKDNWLVKQAGGETRNRSIREIMAEEAQSANATQEKKGAFSKLINGEKEDPTLEELMEMEKENASVN